MKELILPIITSLWFMPLMVFSQSSIVIGAGYEVNSIRESEKSSAENGDFIVPADSPLSAWTINASLRKQITDVLSLNLSATYSQHRYTGFNLGGFVPIDEFGYRRLSLRPGLLYRKNYWIGSVGADVSALFDHFHGTMGVKRNNISSKRPDRFNIQFGISAFVGYQWKKASLQLNTSIGLFYKDSYVEYISTFNTYSVTLFYEVFNTER